MRVRDIMTRDPISVHPSLDLPEAVRILKEHRIRRLPVTTHEKVCGIVTDRDLKEAGPSRANSLDIWDLAYWLSRTTVFEVMKKKVVTISPDAPVANAAVLMYRHKIGGMPVVDEENHLVGIVTSTDVLNLFASLLGALPGSVQAVVADTQENRRRLASLVTLPQVSTLVFSPDLAEIQIAFRGGEEGAADLKIILGEMRERDIEVLAWRLPDVPAKAEAPEDETEMEFSPS